MDGAIYQLCTRRRHPARRDPPIRAEGDPRVLVRVVDYGRFGKPLAAFAGYRFDHERINVEHWSAFIRREVRDNDCVLAERETVNAAKEYLVLRSVSRVSLKRLRWLVVDLDRVGTTD